MVTSKSILWAVAGLIVVIAIVVLIALSRSTSTVPPPTPPESLPEELPPPPPPPEPEPEEEPLITKAEFDSLRSGMTLQQVLQIIVDPESETHSEFDDGIPGYTQPSVTVWYTWKNPDGSSARLGFVRKELTEKEQEGLK